jgi:hypothetical protein
MNVYRYCRENGVTLKRQNLQVSLLEPQPRDASSHVILVNANESDSSTKFSEKTLQDYFESSQGPIKEVAFREDTGIAVVSFAKQSGTV